MASRKIKRSDTTPPPEEPIGAEFDVADLPNLVKRYKGLQNMAKKVTEDANATKETLRAIVVKEVEQGDGYTDEKGSMFVDVTGVTGVKAVKNERRVTEEIDTPRLLEWLESKGLREQCERKVTTVVFDEEAFMRLVWDKKVPERVLKQFTVVKETFALKVV